MSDEKSGLDVWDIALPVGGAAIGGAIGRRLGMKKLRAIEKKLRGGQKLSREEIKQYNYLHQVRATNASMGVGAGTLAGGAVPVAKRYNPEKRARK